MTDKKGNVGSIVVLTISVTVMILILIFGTALSGQTYNLIEDDLDAIANHPVTGQSIIADNTTVRYLGHSETQEGTVRIYNTTHNVTGNFTFTYDDGTFILKNNVLAPAIVNGSTFSIDYTWGDVNVRNSAKNAMLSGFDATEQTGKYLPLYVLGIMIFLILGLVIGLTTLGGNGNMGMGKAL